MKLIDTHCHLEMTQFDADRDEAVTRARKAGVEFMISIASDVESLALLPPLAQKHEHVYFTAGIHPHDAKHYTDEIEARIRAIAVDKKCVGIGETGLDYHYDHSPRDIQKRVFERHLRLALELGLPAIIHVREADDDAIAILRASGLKRGVLHCFSGSPAMLECAREMGLFVSVAGPVTFPKAVELRETVKQIPDELLLVETDAPYLSPVPKRGQRNEPAYVVYTAAEVAALRGVTLEDVARITTLNALKLYGIEAPSKSDETIAYKIRNSLYLNITNRCTSRCTFCVRFHSDFVKGHYLRLSHEPSAEEVKAAVGNPAQYDEVVFCGYGEPMLRLDLIKEVAAWVKEHGGRVRINTNGHGNLIARRNVLPELKGLVDIFSISLDAQDEATYENICRPSFGGAFDAVKDFIREARAVADVVATVVDAPGVDVPACQSIAEELGVRLRVRKLDVVG